MVLQHDPVPQHSLLVTLVVFLLLAVLLLVVELAVLVSQLAYPAIQ